MIFQDFAWRSMVLIESYELEKSDEFELGGGALKNYVMNRRRGNQLVEKQYTLLTLIPGNLVYV